MKDVRISDAWKIALAEEFAKPYFVELAEFVRNEYKTCIVYPPPQKIFRAFDECDIANVKVIILGQDPYHGAGQANGLCFSVPCHARIPPSLQNIFKELESDLGHSVSHDADLTRWSTQGVLLLNATLTVRAGLASSHSKRGWEIFTDAVIRYLNDNHEHLVFILWGNYARAKGAHINRDRHCVIESAHPSPFSAYGGFFGSKPFSRTNKYLADHCKKPIEW